MVKSIPYWRLSGFYGVYFASLGALIPYWGLYLKERGFDSMAIGELMAIVMATKIVSPNIWAWIADHTGHRMRIVRLGSVLAVLGFAAVFFVEDYWPLALSMLVFSFFWNAALPQFEATTLTYLGKDSHRYSMIRLWGSIGFIVAVTALGSVMEHYGAVGLPWVLLGLFMAIALSSFTIPDLQEGVVHSSHEPLWHVLLRREVLALMVVCFLMQASHGPYYTFYTIYLESVGYSGSLIGLLWALGVLAEVLIFLLVSRMMQRWGLYRLMMMAFALTALRWFAIGFGVESLTVLWMAQLLHAASFGVFHAVAITAFHRLFTGHHQSRGQALYSSLSFGAGGALGALFSGILWDDYGPQWAFSVAGLMGIVAWFISWRVLLPVEKQAVAGE